VPNSSGIEVLKTDAFRLQCFQTLTGDPTSFRGADQRDQVFVDYRAETGERRCGPSTDIRGLLGLRDEESILSVGNANSVGMRSLIGI
jgi:Sybindin-like family